MSTDTSIRLAADIGGTFTDVVLDTAGQRYTTKVLTTPRSPEIGVMNGVEVVLADSGVDAADIEIFVHGTTLATNALIERKGAKLAFLTTDGFRDIMEMGFEKRFEHYDVFMDKPVPLVPRTLRYTVAERISARGQTLATLNEQQVRDVAADMKTQDVEAIAVGLMHAYAHPAHEQRVREILAEELPDVTICISSEVCPEIREYERFSTTCANAYVRPLMSGYLYRLADLLKAKNLDCPLFLMMSGGGLTTLDHAARYPIRLVESGPAGGAILAADVALECGIDEVLSFDMGGTTAKICLIENGQPERSRSFEVARMYRDLKGSGMPVRIPVIEMVEIGAGGGSIARVDDMGRITVGPDSAGSEPGPACYGLGGDNATVTDANLALGKLDPDRFAGGKITLSADKSQAVLDRDVGDKLSLKDHWSAAGIAEIVEENMANAARVHAIERGKVINRHTMIAFGGGAPLHAGRLAQKLGIATVIVPKGAGVGSAIGFLRAPVAFEVVRTLSIDFQNFDARRINEVLAEMSQEARSVVEDGATDPDDLFETRIVELRYVGQGHELRVPLPDRNLTGDDAAGLRREFERLYKTIYGLAIEDMDIQSVSWSLTVSSRSTPPAKAVATSDAAAPTAIGQRDLYDAGLGEICDAPVYWRPDFVPGASITGPAIIAEDETSTIVPANFTASINSLNYIVLQNKEGA
ncbi:MAG: hydantoinase/oxoprolinase family protein [Alphaproteobacteria bacterium]|jgi:N-methylhydantoinase A|nr:hydantoinase/oxoprolinase family protein [Alphaproteobacteria bacterium]MBT4965231.1 hydantoinase/oxoprolinase family protein [Alphaproteobacteria bacterium]MBT5159585.1 hydantoinase/oxoprolinase family protein [Alphaproteobacteria bacterium]